MQGGEHGLDRHGQPAFTTCGVMHRSLHVALRCSTRTTRAFRSQDHLRHASSFRPVARDRSSLAWGPAQVEDDRARPPAPAMTAIRARALAALAARNPWRPGGPEPFGRQEREAQGRYQRVEALLREGVGDIRAQGLIAAQRRLLDFSAHGRGDGLGR